MVLELFIELEFGMASIMERCRNPWDKKCKNDDIEVYIVFRGEKLPICRRCWNKIAEKDLEW